MAANFFSPQPTDSFTRYMVEMFDELKIISVPTGFQAFFGRPGAGAETVFSPDANVVDIDIMKGNKLTAALVPRGTVSRSLGSNHKNLNTENFTAFSRKYPLSEEEGDITAGQILNRLAGESPFSAMTRVDRMRVLALQIHMESIRRTVRMFEILARQSVLYGKQDAIIGTTNPDLQYDFKRKATHTITPVVKWDNASGDPMGDIEDGCDRLEESNVTPAFMGLGGGAMKAIIDNEALAGQADNRRYEILRVSLDNPVPPEFSTFIASGWISRGRLVTPNGYELWMFTYNRTYDKSVGVTEKLMPTDQVFITGANVRCDRYFGPPEMLPLNNSKRELYMDIFGINADMPPMPANIMGAGSIVDPNMFYTDAYAAGDGKKLTVRTQSAPIFATTQTDGFVTLLDVLT